MGKSQFRLDICPQASIALAVAVGVASGAAAPAVGQGLPQHMVAYLTGAGQTQCPDNWTEAAYAQGRLILGTTDGAKIQKLAGTPARPDQPPQHSHAYKVTATTLHEVVASEVPKGSTPRATVGQVTSTGTTSPTPTALPWIQFLACEHTAAESPDSAPYATVAFFNAATCPDDWTPLAAADGRFLLPAFPDSTLSYATKNQWDPADPPGHNHGLSSAFTGSVDYETQLLPVYPAVFAKAQTYGLWGTSASAGPVLPFVSLLVCEKGAIGNSEGVPLGTMIFFGGEECPDEWGLTIGTGGRFIVGIGGNGTQGLVLGGDPINSEITSIQHTHDFSGKVELPISAHPGVLGHGVSIAPTSATYSYVSYKATSELPYLVLTACTYTAGQEDWQGAGRPARR